MGKLRKIGKKIGRKFKSLGKRLKRGLGNLAKAFGKLGPLGSIALSFIVPGMGTWINSIAGGSSFFAPIAQGIQTAAGFVNNGVGRVFNRVTDALETGMNNVGSLFGGKGTGGSRFRDFVSNVTNGFITSSDFEGPAIPFDKEIMQKRGEKLFTSEKPSITEKGEFDSPKEKIKGSREYSAYKVITPIEKVGSDIKATEDAKKAEELARQSRLAQYFANVADTTLMRQPDPNIGHINFLSSNQSEEDLFRLQNSYTGILTNK
tara:strand:- start:456 stop:1241 length:786 start_codon:yes stop_codon:yes gene_type:complete